MNKKSLFFLTISFLFLFNLSLVFSLECQLRNEDCSKYGETCVFSLNQETNSHVGDCSYGTWKVCCKEPGRTLTSNVVNTACNSNDGAVLSLYSRSNSHAAQYIYNDGLYHVCLVPSTGSITCTYKPSCDAAGEACLASLNKDHLDNAHMASCATTDPQYQWKVCCGSTIIDADITKVEICDATGQNCCSKECSKGQCPGSNPVNCPTFDCNGKIIVRTTVKNTGTESFSNLMVGVEYWSVSDNYQTDKDRSMTKSESSSTFDLTPGESKILEVSHDVLDFSGIPDDRHLGFWIHVKEASKRWWEDQIASVADDRTGPPPRIDNSGIYTHEGPTSMSSYDCDINPLLNSYFQCNQNFNHEQGKSGSVHFHWDSSFAQYDSVVSGCSGTANVGCYDINGKSCTCGNSDCYYVVECDVNSGNNVKINLKAIKNGVFKVYFRNWDLTKDFDCQSLYPDRDWCDYDRSPGTCSLDCKNFPSDVINCISNDKDVTIGKCNSDSDCNDNNECTQDKCINPRTPDAHCENPNVDDGTTCSGTPGKCCSGVCDKDNVIDNSNYYTECRSGPSCIAKGNWGYSAANQGNGCGAFTDYCNDPLTCDSRKHRKSCSSGYCTGGWADDQDTSGNACQAQDCGTCCKCGSNDNKNYDENQDSDCNACQKCSAIGTCIGSTTDDSGKCTGCCDPDADGTCYTVGQLETGKDCYKCTAHDTWGLDSASCTGNCDYCQGRNEGCSAINPDPCSACNICTDYGSYASCQAQTGETGRLCTDDCTYCNAGTCSDRGAHDWTECTSTCYACTATAGSADNCQADTYTQGKNCLDPNKYCDAGTCCNDANNDNICDSNEICNDGKDNDADGLIDCADHVDCDGKIGPGGQKCCDAPSDCTQDDCVVESCSATDNECDYTNRAAGATDECGTCQACDKAGGNCAGITANSGKNCNTECTKCSSGSCVARNDDTECSTCYYCSNGATGSCSALTADNGKNCNDDCTYCNAGSCNNRNKCAGNECTGQLLCDASGGNCADPDVSSTVCTDCYSGSWNIGGEIAATTCCGDDTNENKRTCIKSSVTEDICSSSYDNNACCNANNKCVYKGSCYANGAANPDYSRIYCDSGTWKYKPVSCGNKILETGEQCEKKSADDTWDSCCDSSTCQFKSSGTVCRAANGDCDAAETCSGSSASCPSDGVKSSGTVCRASAGDCDQAETCDGTNKNCPSDDFKALSTPCQADEKFCTVDHCDGSGKCVFWKDYDCSDFNKPEIAKCNNNPDNNPYTFDYASGFTSVCDENLDKCTEGSYTFTHTCADADSTDNWPKIPSDNGVRTCTALCDQDVDCPSGTCKPDCTCEPVACTAMIKDKSCSYSKPGQPDGNWQPKMKFEWSGGAYAKGIIDGAYGHYGDNPDDKKVTTSPSPYITRDVTSPMSKGLEVQVYDSSDTSCLSSPVTGSVYCDPCEKCTNNYGECGLSEGDNSKADLSNNEWYHFQCPEPTSAVLTINPVGSYELYIQAANDYCPTTSEENHDPNQVSIDVPVPGGIYYVLAHKTGGGNFKIYLECARPGASRITCGTKDKEEKPTGSKTYNFALSRTSTVTISLSSITPNTNPSYKIIMDDSESELSYGRETLKLEDLTSGTYSFTVSCKTGTCSEGYKLSLSCEACVDSDLNGDGTINIVDITIVALAWDTKPGDQKWNVKADLDGNGRIDIVDITKIAINFGKTC